MLDKVRKKVLVLRVNNTKTASKLLISHTTRVICLWFIVLSVPLESALVCPHCVVVNKCGTRVTRPYSVVPLTMSDRVIQRGCCSMANVFLELFGLQFE